MGIPGVLHLISDNIYIDIDFTSCSQNPGSGGIVAYERSTVPEPEAPLLIFISLFTLAVLRKTFQ